MRALRQYVFIFRQFVTKLSYMTTTEPSESKRSVYDSCDPKYLRDLREAAGMDLFVLARTACLSVAQVRQLESDDSDSLFYSDAIKRQAYKRLLMILGAEPPTVEVPENLRDAAKVADAHLATLDHIVAMSQQPSMGRSTSDTLRAGVMHVMAYKQVLGALILLVAAVVLFVLQEPQNLARLGAQTATAVRPVVPEVAVQPLPRPEPVAVAASLSASAPAPVASAAVMVSVPTAAVVAPAAVPAKVASASVTSKASACAYVSDPMPQLSPFTANKEGRYVYLVSAGNTEVCVVDGNKQATSIQLKAGENRSVYGVSPWQVSGTDLQKVQIYFQGGRVSLPDAATNRVKLVEVAVAR